MAVRCVAGRQQTPLAPVVMAPTPPNEGARGEEENGGAEELSRLVHIEAAEGSDPVALFHEWRATAAARGALMADAMVLATVNGAREVSARTVKLRRMDGDAFVFMTDARSRKAADLAEHPAASVVFQWNYREGARCVNRQVRAAGAVTALPRDAFGDMYAREPLFCWARAHLCHQGQVVDWAEHAARHDALLAAHRQSTARLDDPPDHTACYRLTPDWLEFYSGQDDSIADRVLFTRCGDGWRLQHLAA